jgi:signal transduction histidine kinase
MWISRAWRYVRAVLSKANRESPGTKGELKSGSGKDAVKHRERRTIATGDPASTVGGLQQIDALSAIGSAAARIAHEVANPINAIFTTVQLLERFLERGESDRAAAAVKDIRDEVRSLKSLLEELREFSRSTTAAGTIAPVSVGTLINDALSAQAVNGKKIDVERQIAEDLPLVLGDKERLTDALLSLTKNAVEAMPDGGTLIVRGYLRQKDVCIEVKDTGLGIPQGMKIFEPFTTSKNSGWGLGLPKVLHAVSAHRGKVEYVSEPGHGTTFTISLPTAS